MRKGMCVMLVAVVVVMVTVVVVEDASWCESAGRMGCCGATVCR